MTGVQTPSLHHQGKRPPQGLDAFSKSINKPHPGSQFGVSFEVIKGVRDTWQSAIWLPHGNEVTTKRVRLIQLVKVKSWYECFTFRPEFPNAVFLDMNQVVFGFF